MILSWVQASGLYANPSRQSEPADSGKQSGWKRHPAPLPDFALGSAGLKVE